LQQGDTCGAIGVIFNGDNFGFEVKLIALEVDDTIATFVTTTTVTDSDAPLLLRPPVLRKAVVRLRSGFFLVISSNV
jgi:hypothetical protein